MIIHRSQKTWIKAGERRSGHLLLPFALATVAAVALGCTNPSSSDNTPPASQNVYIAGASFTSTTGPFPTYWKNGSPSQIETAEGNYAYAIQATGGHIYIAGGTKGSGPLMYWKDGIKTTAPFPAGYSGYNQGFAVDTVGNVYQSGFGANGSGNVPILWKNGTGTALSIGTGTHAWYSNQGMQGNNIAVLPSGDCHVVATVQNASGSNSSPAYWSSPSTTPTAFPLWGADTAGSVYSVIAVGSDWYATGDSYTPNSTPNVPIVWKDGVVSGSLYNPPGYQAASALNIAVSGSNTYVVGAATIDWSSSIPVLWTNGVPTVLSLPTGVTGSAAATYVAVSGTTVYVVGSVVGSTVDSGFGNLTNAGTPLLWTVKGSAVTAAALPLGSNTVAQLVGVGLSGTDLYVAGMLGTGLDGNGAINTTPDSVYWKGGATTPTALTPAGTNTGVWSGGFSLSTQ